MKLFTKEQYDQLIKNGSPQHSGKDHDPVVKLFTPDADCTWLITEIVDEDRAFGLCDLGHGFPELGYLSISEIANLRGHLGLPAERDLFFEAKYPISVYTEAALYNQCITLNGIELKKAELRLQRKPEPFQLRPV
ncbi:MAG: DUF2958 domain-containing protein [Bacteroidota bacterium]